MSNRVAVLIRQAPYGSVYTAEGFRTLMGIAVFEMDIQVIFMDDGVYALKKNQHPDKLDMKPLGEGFPQLREFETVKVCLHDASLTERGLAIRHQQIAVEPQRFAVRLARRSGRQLDSVLRRRRLRGHAGDTGGANSTGRAGATRCVCFRRRSGGARDRKGHPRHPGDQL